MNNYRRFLDYMIKQKGQSLAELASFGAVLLLCLGMLVKYGMEANYQQNLQMQAFRKALKAAYYKSGPSASVSILMAKDKAVPNPQDPWGFADRGTMAASASATWDSNIQALYIDDVGEEPKQSDLPRSVIEINDTLGLKDEDLRDGAIDNIDSSKGAFKTADYGQGGCSGQIMVVIENPGRAKFPPEYQEYKEIFVPCEEIRVKDRKPQKEGKDDPGKKYAYIKIDGLVHTVLSADVDGDNVTETIIAVQGTKKPCDDNGYCGGVQLFKYLDSQQGEIDSEYTMIGPWETNKCQGDINCQQGLINRSKVIKNYNNTLVKTETPRSINTTTTLGSQQEITHTIRLNKQGERNYTTTFKPAKGAFSWGVSK